MSLMTKMTIVFPFTAGQRWLCSEGRSETRCGC